MHRRKKYNKTNSHDIRGNTLRRTNTGTAKHNRRQKERCGRRCFNFGSDGFNGKNLHFIEHITGRIASRNSSGHWKFIRRLRKSI